MGQGTAGHSIDFAIDILVANVLEGFPVQIFLGSEVGMLEGGNHT